MEENKGEQSIIPWWNAFSEVSAWVGKVQQVFQPMYKFLSGQFFFLKRISRIFSGQPMLNLFSFDTYYTINELPK